MKFIYFTLALLVLAFSVKADIVIDPTAERGATVFNDRCSLCHGNIGMGDGLLPRLIDDYPNTNLRNNKNPSDPVSLREAIIYGGEKNLLDERMPPFGDELTWLEIESLVVFLRYYHRNSEKAIKLLADTKKPEKPNRSKGRALYKGRCILCHGVEGDGKGKMAKIIKTPPPFNFQYSRLPNNMIQDIVSKGGAAVGRSPKMPPFGDELSESDINSLILYIKGFRI